jgi:hypothetical protein
VILGVLVTGCSGGVNVLMDQKQAQAAGVGLEGPIAMDGMGSVYVISKGLVWRYDVAKGAFQQETPAASNALADLAVGEDDVVLALDGGRILALASGNPVPVAAAPGRPYRLSVGGGCLYVATHREGKDQVVRYRLASRRWEPVLQSESPITAICGLEDGALVACGESIHKVSSARSATQPATEVSTALVCAIYGAEIMSIVADPQRQIFYFSDGRTTFFWADGQVRELMPSGGRLALRNNTLAICSPTEGHLVQVTDAAMKVKQICAAFASPPR